jgi:hypothetical protein
LLQALGGDLVSKDYVRRHLPSDINPKDEEAKINVEKLRGSLLEGLSGWVQSLPALAAQGQDPSPIIQGVVSALRDVQKGKSLEDALTKVFPAPPPPEPAPAAPEGAPPGMPGMPGAPDPGAAFDQQGIPNDLTAGIQSRGPNARPDMSLLFAGTNSNGSPNLQSGVSRFLPAGGGV